MRHRGHPTIERLTLGPIQNPVRAFLCGIGALLAVVGGVFLWLEGAGDPARQVALVLFALSLVGLLTVSALYHGWRWTRPEAERLMQRVDHSMIYVLIAGTQTPVAFVVLEGWMRVAILAATWSIATVGVLQKAFLPKVRKRYSVALQIGQGWLAALCIAPLSERLPAEAMNLLVAGGLVYTLGAIAYVTRRPRLWPRIFSYHELFHVCVVCGGALHYSLALLYLAPFGVH